jgi:hypothetical protein
MKLTRTNNWIWRTGELSYKQFTQLTKEEKDAHINLLLQLGIENLSTNDLYILSIYAPNKLSTPKKNNFFEL